MRLRTVVKYTNLPKLIAVIEDDEGVLRRIGYGWQKKEEPNRLPDTWYDAVIEETKWQQRAQVSLDRIFG